MRINYVTLRNFLSYGTPEQRVDLADRGLVAVTGRNLDSQGADSNGSGKSTIMEAIVWSLYGQTLRGYRGDSVVNRTIGKNCAVSICLEDGDTQYLIRRARKFGSKNPNQLTLHVNGTEATQGTTADTQGLIQTIVGMDFATFTQSVMMWSGSKSFSQMTDREQKAVLEDILQIDKISRAKDVVRGRMVERQQELALSQNALQVVITKTNDIHVTLSKLNTAAAQHEEMMRQKRHQLVWRKAEVGERLEEVCHNTGLDKLLKLQEDLGNQEAKLGASRTHVQTRRLEVTRKFATRRAEIARLEGAASARLSQLRTASESLERLAGHSCPTCTQDVTPDVAEVCLVAWEEEAQGIRNGSIRQLADETNENYRKEQVQFAALTLEESDITKEWNSVQAQSGIASENVRKRKASLQLICQLEQQSWNIQQEIDSLEDESHPYEALIIDAGEKLEDLDKVHRSTRYRIKALGIELAHLTYWNQGFSNQGLKSYIMDNVVPFLTERAQEYADVISGGDIQVSFSTQTKLKSGAWKEQFSVTAVNKQGADVYQGNSDGERRRIDVAVGWALADLAATRAKKAIRFRGLDEPFVHLDETGEDLVIKLLHKVLPQYETVMCVTHSTHLRSQFPEEIVVTKKNGFSEVT